MQKFSDEPLKIHEACGGDVERLISAPALQFKGSGWYVTDYGHGRNGKSPSTSGANGSESKNEAKKAEPAPDAKTTPKNTK